MAKSHYQLQDDCFKRQVEEIRELNLIYVTQDLKKPTNGVWKIELNNLTDF